MMQGNQHKLWTIHQVEVESQGRIIPQEGQNGHDLQQGVMTKGWHLNKEVEHLLIQEHIQECHLLTEELKQHNKG